VKGKKGKERERKGTEAGKVGEKGGKLVENLDQFCPQFL